MGEGVHISGLLQFVDAVNDWEEEELEEADHLSAFLCVICLAFLKGGQHVIVEDVFDEGSFD